MSTLLNDSRSLLPDHDLAFLAETSTVLQSHHFNLFFDQTVDDALGADRGMAVRTRAAHEATYGLLSALFRELRPASPEEALDLAGEIFGALGHGRIDLDVDERGGSANAPQLHYSAGWLRKYGRRLPRIIPVDGFAAGFVAAAAELAQGLEAGALSCVQTHCQSMGAGRAEFDVRKSGARVELAGLDELAARAAAPPALSGLHEERIAALAGGLREVLWDLSGDARGLIDAFGVLLTCHPTDYYGQLAHRALDSALADKPRVLDTARELFREAGQVSAFHTMAGILVSPEWEALGGASTGDALDVVIGGLAIARALGYGRWGLEAHVPDESLVIRSSGTYESIYNKARIKDSDTPCSYMLQGGALAIMQLAHQVSWQPTPIVGHDRYVELRRSQPWSCRQTHCVARGDAMDRVVVMREST
jgi:hypothetical protein